MPGSSHTPIRTGLLSFGMSGQVFHAPFLHDSPFFAFQAVVERSRKLANSHYKGVVSYDSVDDLLADKSIELVIVNTPNNTHADYAIKSLAAGKHVLIEKPFASSSEEAKAIFSAARRAGKLAIPYHNRRWDSDFLSLQQVIRDGALGDLIELHIRFDRYRASIGPKVFKETNIPGSGVLYDLGSHLLDQVICLFGEPLQSIKIGNIHRQHSQVDDVSSLVLVYPNGFTVYLHASLLVAGPLPAYVLHGTRGSFHKNRVDVQETQLQAGMVPSHPEYGMEPDGQAGQLFTVDANGGRIVTNAQVFQGDYRKLFESVYAQLRLDVPFPVTAQEVLWQMEILEQSLWNIQ